MEATMEVHTKIHRKMLKKSKIANPFWKNVMTVIRAVFISKSMRLQFPACNFAWPSHLPELSFDLLFHQVCSGTVNN